jgi:two-component system response regulator AtoC
VKVLVVDDERSIRDSLARLCEFEGMEARSAPDGETAMGILGETSFDAVILDLRLPGMDGQALLEWMRAGGLRTPVVMISAHGEIDDAVRSLKAGADDYLVKPFDPAELMVRLRSCVETRRSEDMLEAERRTKGLPPRLEGASPAMRDLLSLIARAAPESATVLITGESGTGKELVAREIHARSRRSGEAFVAVNLGALPESLVESELFGHEKGAFTGAESRRAGLFELAGPGSLFLDEIAEMPLHLQVKLLRVLQERKLRRLGGDRDIPVEARIIAATNRDLEAEVSAGRFREDLFYRLDVLRIRVPALSERREDIPLLAEAILKRIASRSGASVRGLSPAAIEALRAYEFPGNVRELENILERAVILGADLAIGAIDLGLPSSRRGGESREGAEATGEECADAAELPLDAMEREAILKALERCGGNRTKAAKELGISRRTMLYRLKDYGFG